MSDFRPIQIGKYLLVEPIGGGGMGQVYRGKLLGAGKFSKELAIKRILPAATSDPELKTMFEAEATICSRLNHPNIVSVFDFFHSDQGFLMAMEFLKGKNLRQITHRLKVDDSGMPIEMILYITNEVCKGLDYAHSITDSEGKKLLLIHRDVSPQNIMVSYEGAVKIVDFGIAKTRERSDFTRTGTVKGKVAYMSPEQTLGQPLDQTTDIYSLGVVLHELLARERLFSGANESLIMQMIANAEIEPPSKFNPAVPPELDAIVMKALARRPYERYQTGGQFSDAISDFLKSKKSSYQSRNLSHWMHEHFEADIDREKEASLNLLTQMPLSLISTEELPTTQKNLKVRDVPALRTSRQNSWGLEHLLVLVAMVGVSLLGYLVFYKSQATPAAPAVAQSPAQNSAQNPDGRFGNATGPEMVFNMARTLGSWNDRKPLPVLRAASLSEIETLIREHGSQIDDSKGWSHQEKIGNSSMTLGGLYRVPTDLNQLKRVLSDFEHLPQWINSGKQMNAQEPQNGFQMSEFKFVPGTKNEFEFAQAAIDGKKMGRKLHIELTEEGGTLLLSSKLDEVPNHGLRAAALFIRFLKPKKPANWVWGHFDYTITCSNSLTLNVAALTIDPESWTRKTVPDVIDKYLKRVKVLRELASEPQK